MRARFVTKKLFGVSAKEMDELVLKECNWQHNNGWRIASSIL
jgi:hypothetical protein